MLSRPVVAALLLTSSLSAAAVDADFIDTNIQRRHMPFGAILDPIFTASTSDQIKGYTRCGDSAIWTGHYLAAEAFRYKVTRDPAALANAWTALEGLRHLVYVTGGGLLARCAVPVESDYAPDILSEEKANGVHTGSVDQRGYFWIGNTSRDQYLGAFFGLAAARDLIDDPAMPPTIADLVWRMLDYLEQHGWSVVMPDGSSSTTFTLRPEQQLSLLQVGRQALPDRFGPDYTGFADLHFFLTPAPITFDVQDPHGSYFKFNLDYISLYNLIRYENSATRRSVYQQAYDILRRTTDDHQNAFFNMLDHALNGPNAQHDPETAQLLNAWLQRPRRDFYVDLTGRFQSCSANEACSPVPVALRPPTDFLWQRDPFQLFGGGSGLIESSGIDYLLPYWMARYFGVIRQPLTRPLRLRSVPSR